MLFTPRYFSVHFLQTRTFSHITRYNCKNQEININILLLINFQNSFMFINCSVLSFVAERSHSELHVALSCHESSLLLERFLSLSLPCRTATFSRVQLAQLFCRASLSLGSSHDQIQIVPPQNLSSFQPALLLCPSRINWSTGSSFNPFLIVT